MSYRDDVQALHDRKEALERQLAAIRARQRETEQLSKEADAIAKELEHTYARINTSKGASKRSLPLLQRIYVASPCNVPWESMQGDDHVRHCASCDKEVFDLSSLTRDEAEKLLIEKKGKLCAQYYRRADGTVLTADCSVGVAKKKKARRKAAVVAGAFAAAAAGAIAGAFAMREEREEGCAMVSQPEATPAELPTTVTNANRAAPPDEGLSQMRGDVAFEPPAQPQPPARPHVRGVVRVR